MKYSTRHLLFALAFLCSSAPLQADEPEKTFVELVTEFFEDVATYGKDNLKIIYTMCIHPNEVSAVAASSPWTGKSLVKYVTSDKPQRIWEVGFGPGNITRQIIKKKNAATALDGVELLEEFYTTALNELQLSSDSNVSLNLCGAEDWVPRDYDGAPLYDTVISTLAFTTLPPEVCAGIIKKIARLLKPGGTFSFITYMLSRSLGYCKWNNEEREAYAKKIDAFDALLEEDFRLVKTDKVFLNVPPTYIYHWVKK